MNSNTNFPCKPPKSKGNIWTMASGRKASCTKAKSTLPTTMMMVR